MTLKIISFNDLRPVKGIPYSKSQLRRLEAAGKFPKRIAIGERCVAWLESELDEWIAERAGTRAFDGRTLGNQRTHGMSGASEYTSWRQMIQRCTNPNRDVFKHYGGRGITVCNRWLSSFEAFLADMGPKPSPDHSIDRIDNDGPYSPDNCQWSTQPEQMRNRRRTRTNGETTGV